MKYRILTDEELEVFAEDLKHFLIVNGVHAEEWEQINKEDPRKAVQLVEMFSDSVLQIVYEKVKFIEHRSPKSCMVFQLKENEIDLISLTVKEGATADLSTPESIHEALVNNSSDLSIFKTAKKYTEEREVEIHKMLEQGCVNSSESFWLSLSKLLP